MTYRSVMRRALLLCVLLPCLLLSGRPARADHFSFMPMSDGGREHGVVASHGMDLFDITSPAGGYSPARRAEIIAGRLEELTQSHDDAPEMFSVGHRNGEVILQQQEHTGHPPHIIVTVSRRLTSDGNAERLAQWWLALLRDHLALADGRRPIYTAGTPVGDVFQGLYERLGDHVKPVSSADIERAFDALPPLQRQAFRQAAAAVPEAYSLDRLAPGGPPPQDSPAVGLSPLLLVFLKIGSVVYGSGYVLLAFLRADLVTRLHWLTSAQLLDAVAVGQFTPGPVFTTATFIGYVLAGPWGALVATVGMFLPAFVLVAVSGPLVPRIRHSPTAAAFLDGVNVAALALMAFVTWQLDRAALVDGVTVALAVAAAGVLFRFRINSAWLVLGGALVGLLLRH